jgi:hypothetical protein
VFCIYFRLGDKVQRGCVCRRGCMQYWGRRSRCIHTHTHSYTHRLGVVNGIFAQRLSRFPCCGSHGVWLVFSSHHRPLCTLGATKTAARAHSVQPLACSRTTLVCVFFERSNRRRSRGSAFYFSAKTRIYFPLR